MKIKCLALMTWIPVNGEPRQLFKDDEVTITAADLEEIKRMEYLDSIVEVIQPATTAQKKGKE